MQTMVCLTPRSLKTHATQKNRLSNYTGLMPIIKMENLITELKMWPHEQGLIYFMQIIVGLTQSMLPFVPLPLKTMSTWETPFLTSLNLKPITEGLKYQPTMTLLFWKDSPVTKLNQSWITYIPLDSQFMFLKILFILVNLTTSGYTDPPHHASNVPIVINIQTENVSPPFHCVWCI